MIRALAALLLMSACEKQEPRETVQLPPIIQVTRSEITGMHQLIVGVIDDWGSSRATLQRWTRTGDDPWTRVGAAWDAVIGRHGAAWGNGMQDVRSGTPRKKEGDGNSPAGMFHLRGAYGYAASPPEGTKLSYTPSTDKLECVDDPRSRHYTEIVDSSRVDRDWTSSEQMRLQSDAYKWVIDIAHNPKHAPGEGSCIFFHIWAGPDSTTDGCTAMPEDKLVELMTWLDPAADPVYVLLPRAHYESVRATWALP